MPRERAPDPLARWRPMRLVSIRMAQNGVPTNQFITRKLWDVGNTAPYGHRGDLTTITEAILHHAGEARPQRERFATLSKESQNEIVEFLKQLQVLPNGAPREITDRQLKRLLRNQKGFTAEELMDRRPIYCCFYQSRHCECALAVRRRRRTSRLEKFVIIASLI